MRPLLQILGQTTAAFGFIATSVALLYALIFQESLRYDDPYIMGWMASVLIVPGFALALIIEQCSKRVARCVYIIYLATWSIPLLYGFFYGELHGPGIALIALVSMAIFAPAVFFLFRPDIMWLRRVGWSLTVLFLAAFTVVYLR